MIQEVIPDTLISFLNGKENVKLLYTLVSNFVQHTKGDTILYNTNFFRYQFPVIIKRI